MPVISRLTEQIDVLAISSCYQLYLSHFVQTSSRP